MLWLARSSPTRELVKMSKKKLPSGLKLTVEGTRLELVVAFAAVTGKGLDYGKSLAQSKAGSSGVSSHTCCGLVANAEEVQQGGAARVCGSQLKMPRVCEAHPGVPMTKETTVKGFSLGGDALVYLSHAQVDALKVRGDNSVHVLKLLTQEEAGGLGFSERFHRLMGDSKAIVPVDLEDAGLMRRYAGLRALLAGRVGVARVVHKTSFYYALLTNADGGSLVVHPLYLPRDAYDVPRVEIPQLSEREAEAFATKGASLAEGVTVDAGLGGELDENLFRQAFEDAVLAAVEGRVVVEAPKPVVAPREEVDLLACL